MSNNNPIDRPLRYKDNRMYFDSIEEYEYFDKNNQGNPRWIHHQKETLENGMILVHL